jgi:cell division protein FtsI (penicillin-binding protein 3)
MGFAPMANPQVVVVVTLNGTHGENGFGGHTAAPVFKVVAGEALRVYDVPKDLPENVPARTLVAGNAEDLNDLAIADLGESRPNILEEAEEAEIAVGQAAPEGTPLNAAAPRPVYGPQPVPTASAVGQGPRAFGAPPGPPPAPPKPQGPRVPNFRGMTMRAVLAEAAAKGLSILPDGSGVARVQSPPPGTPLHQGERIRVQFAR